MILCLIRVDLRLRKGVCKWGETIERDRRVYEELRRKERASKWRVYRLLYQIDRCVNLSNPFEIKEDKEQDDQPDEDGWVTVTAKSRKSNRPFTEKNIEKIQKKQKKRKQQMVGSISFIYYRYFIKTLFTVFIFSNWLISTASKWKSPKKNVSIILFKHIFNGI